MSNWRDAVRQRVLAYVSMAATGEKGHLDAAEVNRVLSHLFGRPQELELLRGVHFLMHHWNAIHSLVFAVAPRLLRELTRNTVRTTAETEGRVEGSIDWGRTVPAQVLRPTLYLSTTPRATYVTPENQALVYLLHALAGVADGVLGAATDEEGTPAGTHERLGDRAELLRHGVRGLLRHPAMRLIPPPKYLQGQHWSRLAQTRNPLYRPALALCEAYRDVVLSDHRLAEVMQSLILLPASEDTLFELYALMAVIDALPPETERRLIYSGREAVAFWRSPTTTVEVFYNQSLFAGQYKQLFEHYDLSPRSRRPDITLRLKNGSETRHLLIEVKNTVNTGYIVDSVYKVMGYLKDFEADFATGPDPKAILFVAGGVQRIGQGDAKLIEIITPADVETGRLAAVVDGFVGNPISQA